MDEITVDLYRANFICKFKSLMGNNFKPTVEFPAGQCLTTKEDVIKPNIIEIFEKSKI